MLVIVNNSSHKILNISILHIKKIFSCHYLVIKDGKARILHGLSPITTCLLLEQGKVWLNCGRVKLMYYSHF